MSCDFFFFFHFHYLDLYLEILDIVYNEAVE